MLYFIVITFQLFQTAKEIVSLFEEPFKSNSPVPSEKLVPLRQVELPEGKLAFIYTSNCGT